jgi:hypothetical protein
LCNGSIVFIFSGSGSGSGFFNTYFKIGINLLFISYVLSIKGISSTCSAFNVSPFFFTIYCNGETTLLNRFMNAFRFIFFIFISVDI